MCSHNQTLEDAERLLTKFRGAGPGVLSKCDAWPRY